MAEGFTFDLPLWFVAIAKDARTTAKSLADPNIGFPRAKNNAGEFFLQLFTDSDLAQRFAEWFGIAKPLILSVNDPATLLSLLSEAETRGFTHIGFDYIGEEYAHWTNTIDELRETMLKTIGST